MLVLPIKKKWFDMIASGEKKEEYREKKPYYDKRLVKYFDEVDWPRFVVFRNGYSKKSPQIKCLCRLKVDTGKKKWGAEKGKRYYVLKILRVLGDEK